MKKTKIKICHVASSDMTVKFLLLEKLKFLISQGFDVYAVCSPGSLVKDIESQGIRVKTIKITRKMFTPFSDLAALFKMYRYFKREKFDFVHTHALKSGLLGQLAARAAKVPITTNTIHGLYSMGFFLNIERITAWCSDLVVSQSKEDIKTLLEKKVVRPEKIWYLGNGVNIEKFNPERFSKGPDAKDFKVIGTVGRLVKEKGYMDLFEAFKIVLKKFPKTQLWAVGPQEPEKKDRFSPEIVKDFGIEKNVVFWGQRDDLPQLYSSMDIFVLASWREGFPRSVLEAMAMQKPVVATDIRGCREEIDDKINGILVPAKNPEKLAEAILFFLENPKEAERMARAARQKCAKEFDERLVFNRIKEKYEKFPAVIERDN